MSNPLAKLAGDLLGVIGGGRSQVTAAAVTAKVTQALDKTRSAVLNKTKALGAQLGPRIGADFFKALEEGAAPAAAEARADEAQRRFGVGIDPRDLPMLGKYFLIGAVVVLALILVWRAATK